MASDAIDELSDDAVTGYVELTTWRTFWHVVMNDSWNDEAHSVGNDVNTRTDGLMSSTMAAISAASGGDA